MRKRVTAPKPESYEVVFCKPPNFAGPQHAPVEFTLTREAALALAELMHLNRLPDKQKTHLIKTSSGYRFFLTRMT